jgi:hypothetical protein
MNARFLRNRRLFMTGLLTVLGPAVVWAACGPGSALGKRDAAPSERALADVGREFKRQIRERMRAGEPLTPTFMRDTCEWSRRVCLADVAAATDKAAKERSTADHLDTTKGMVEVLINREPWNPELPPYVFAQMRFYEEEAKLWDARVKAGKPIGAIE